MIFLIFLVIAIICVIAWLLTSSRQKVKRKISCPEGKFSVRGTKNRFVVKKGQRFVFVVENGQITSVKDRAASSKWIKYGDL